MPDQIIIEGVIKDPALDNARFFVETDDGRMWSLSDLPWEFEGSRVRVSITVLPDQGSTDGN